MTREASSDSIRAPGEQVAEQTEGQGERLGHLLDQVDEGVDRASG